MRVLVLGRGYPTSRHPAYGTFEVEQAVALSDAGHEVIYSYVDSRLMTDVRRVGFRRVEAEGGRPDVVGIDLPFRGLPPFLNSVLKTIGFNTIVREILKDRGPIDLVYVHFPAAVLTKGILRTLRKERLALAIMEHWSRVLTGTLPRRRRKVLSEASDQAVLVGAVSEPLAVAMRSKGYVKATETIHVVPNIVSRPHQDADGRGTRSETTGRRFVSVGRLVPSKRFDLLLEAFSRVSSSNDSWTLTIVGGGPELSRLKALSTRLKLDARVSFLGALPNGAVWSELKKSDCYISSSSLETFGVPVVEAWLCGLPVIAPDNAPLAPHFNDDNGFLFATDECDSLADAIDRFIAQPDRFDRAAVAASATEVFGSAVVGQRLSELLLSSVRRER